MTDRLSDYFGAPPMALVGMAAVLAVVLLVGALDPLGTGLAGGVLAGGLLAATGLVVEGVKLRMPPGRLTVRLLAALLPTLAWFGFAALGVGGREAFDDGATRTGAVVAAIALLAGQAGRVNWLAPDATE